MLDLELYKLKTDAVQKLRKFLPVLNKQSEENISSNAKDFDIQATSEYLERNTPEGIDYKMAVNKLKKYIAETPS